MRTASAQHVEPTWPTTDRGWCDWFRRLDITYLTSKRSPLHHNQRCPIHAKAVS